FSAMLVSPIFTKMSQNIGWRETFVILGIVAAVVFVLASFFMKAPGPDYKFPEPKKKKAAAQPLEEVDCPPFKMIQKVAFWCFFVWGILLCACGLAVNSQAYPLAEGVFLGSPMGDTMTAAAMAGMLSVIVSLFSVFNGVGRVLFGALFDRKGGVVTLFAVTICFIIAGVIMAAALSFGSFGLVTFGLIFMGLSYGGMPTMSSAFTRKTFGSKNYPINLPIVNLNLLVASFVGPTMAARMFDAAGSYLGPMLCVIVFAIIALVCAVLLRKRV
ncbi:MAG: MFS transporter, partial [Firmicutes bacterium]|nr:MFS transporter [Bacillota bacterium]